MKITSLRLQDFRSYQDRVFDFDQDQIIFCGPNGIGKTNVLEAISVLSVGKSWREQQLQDLINLEADSAQVTGQTELGDQWQGQLGQRQRRFLKNEKPLPRTKLIGQLPTLLFCPEYLQMLTGPKSPRVMFFDRFLVQCSPVYRQALLKANKAHKQKTALLRSIRAEERTDGGTLLKPWNQILSETMPVITEIRQQILSEINPLLQAGLHQVAPTQEALEIKLIPAEDIMMTQTGILDWFDRFTGQEIAVGKNFIAPQRDDFMFLLRGQSLGATASRGEVRTVLLALLSAQKQYFLNQKKTAPILLLDDVFSELDDHRQATLESLCKGCQTFFTTTHQEHFGRFSRPVQVFQM